MSAVLVDSNVILDVVTEDPKWGDWSSAAMERVADESSLVINPLVYAEVSMGVDRIEELESAPTYFCASRCRTKRRFSSERRFCNTGGVAGRGARRCPTFMSAPTQRSRGTRF